MKGPFSRCTNFALGFVMFSLVLSPVTGMGGDLPQNLKFLEAKVTPETKVVTEEPNVFDKSEPHIKKAMDIQDRHTPRLMTIPGVVGTAVVLSDSGKPAVMVLTSEEMVPGMLPESLEDTPVLVRVTGEIIAMKAAATVASNTGVFVPPVPIGVSTGNIGECSAGTISARVLSGANVYALSNNHVFALENSAPIGSHLLQPGLFDTKCMVMNNNALGTLAKFAPIQFNNTACNSVSNPAACNRIDAALAITSKRMMGNGTPSRGYGIPNSRTYTQATNARPYVGQAVQKYGRTTSLTTGAVTGINATVTVNYGPGKNATFIDQIIVSSAKAFIKPGDSGSLMVTNDTHAYPVGLLFAGSSSGTLAIANPIDSVLTTLGVTIDGANR